MPLHSGSPAVPTRRSVATASLLLLGTAGVALAGFTAAVTPPFRGTPSASFAGWDAFTTAVVGAVNAPDDPASDLDARLVPLTPGTVLTGTGNLYHPGLPSEFEIEVDLAHPPREVVLQVRTLGNPLDLASVALVLGGGGAPIAPDATVRLAGPGAADEWYFAFDASLASAVETSFEIRMAASLANMSLDAVLLDVREDGSIHTSYCPAVANSTGAPAEASAHGSDLVASNDVVVRASSMPQHAFGYLLVSRTQGFVVAPGGSRGNLCLGGSIGRYASAVQSSGPLGEFSVAIDWTAVPMPTGTVAAVAGDTWNFQAWYRDADPGPTSNFTDGISVTLR